MIFICDDIFIENGEDIIIGKALGSLFNGASRFFKLERSDLRLKPNDEVEC